MGVANLITNINQTQINGFGMILGKISSITNINQVVTSAEQSQEFPQKQGGRENYDQYGRTIWKLHCCASSAGEYRCLVLILLVFLIQYFLCFPQVS